MRWYATELVTPETPLLLFFEVSYAILFATILLPRASNKQLKRINSFSIWRRKVSLKAPVVVLWACLIAGAAVASESHRLCVEHSHTQLQRLHEDLQLHKDEVELLIVTEVDVTN